MEVTSEFYARSKYRLFLFVVCKTLMKQWTRVGLVPYIFHVWGFFPPLCWIKIVAVVCLDSSFLVLGLLWKSARGFWRRSFQCGSRGAGTQLCTDTCPERQLGRGTASGLSCGPTRARAPLQRTRPRCTAPGSEAQKSSYWLWTSQLQNRKQSRHNSTGWCPT